MLIYRQSERAIFDHVLCKHRLLLVLFCGCILMFGWDQFWKVWFSARSNNWRWGFCALYLKSSVALFYFEWRFFLEAMVSTIKRFKFKLYDFFCFFKFLLFKFQLKALMHSIKVGRELKLRPQLNSKDLFSIFHLF